MEVKKGYKLTELGVIPEDWEITKLGSLLDFKNGLNKGSEFFGYGTPIINYMDVFRYNGMKLSDVKGKVFLNSQERNSFSAKKGDVFFTRTSEIPEEIGIASVLLEEIPDCVFSGFVLRGRPKNNKITPEYFQYCLIPSYVRRQIISTSSYTTRALTNGRYLSNVKLLFPSSLHEQTAIATALSDMDALITQTEKLIEKKKAMKQGMMQELLKPKKGWVTKKLGDIVDKVTTGKLDANAMKPDGEYRFYTCAKEYNFIDRYSFDDEALLISGNGANVGYIHYYKGKFNAYQRTYVLIGFKIDVFFLKLYLDKYLADRISTEVSAGNTPYIKMDTITEMMLKYPIAVNEQSAISIQINDVNKEIDLIETKLQKLKLQKQGMMQELLTGRIRLL